MLRIDHAQSGISCGSTNESAGFWSASALNHGFCEKQGGGNSRKRFEFHVSSFRRNSRDNSSAPTPREFLLLVLSCCFRLAARSSAAWEAQKIGSPPEADRTRIRLRRTSGGLTAACERKAFANPCTSLPRFERSFTSHRFGASCEFFRMRRDQGPG